LPERDPPAVLALFGPTSVGKTDVAVAVAERLRGRGEDPVAISCDALQVYQGIETLTGAATTAERLLLEHRLVSFVPLTEEFSAGRFAELARTEIDALLAAGRRPIVVGGTGLYLQAALTDLELRPPVDSRVRMEVEREIAEGGSAAVHRQIDPTVASAIDPRDRKRVARAMELQRAGHRAAGPEDSLWTKRLRRPTLLVGLTMSKEALDSRIEERVQAMAAAGAAEEARRAREASRTARSAIGVSELLVGDLEAMKRAHRAYAKRQMTWMRKLEGVRIIDRTRSTAQEVASEIVETLDP
jgi:tRNA dimethylallyltransferase